MRIGVWLGFELKESAGGAFSYTDRLIELIDEHNFPKGIEVCFVNFIGTGHYKKEVCPILNLPKYLISLLKKSHLLYRLVKCFVNFIIKKRGLTKMLAGKGISIIYYPHQGQCLDSNFPFIATNWDIGHRSSHAFPELVTKGNAFEKRESFYRMVLPKALMIFCESRAGAEEIAKYTNIGEHKLRILPMFGGSVTQQHLSEEDSLVVLEKYGLEKGKYYFYPAQFWAHKNHRNLILAFGKVHELHPELKLVLSGSDKGNLAYIKQIIAESDLTKSVIFLGFVPIKELYCMYKYATALVMASHFGPTNMPPIEAMTIGCPVACSDLDGHKEILGNAACYFDSYDWKSMTKSMLDIFNHQNEYKDKINARKRETDYTEDKSMIFLDKLLMEVAEIRSNWK